jgi:phosphatidylserine/phosphatidylglycerophosphate/cardiolipin synthase-like enzyme
MNNLIIRIITRKTVLLLIASLVVSTSAFSKRRKSFPKKHTKAKVEEIDLSTIEAPKDGEVCFSPDEPCAAKLIKFIQTATKSIDVAIYDINIEGLVSALLEKTKAGVKVRVVCDKKQSQGDHSLVDSMVDAGINLKFGHQNGIFHDKFTIIDDKIIETGSFNYTNHAFTANQENQVYLSNEAIVKRYTERFSKIWTNAKDAE